MVTDFKLGYRDYTVQYVEDIDDNGLGRTYSMLGIIKLATSWNGRFLPEDSVEQTLYHEVVHAILDELGYKELSDDETFVQGFSLLLQQFENTKTKINGKTD